MVIPQSSRLNHRTEVNSNEFHAYCLSLATRIDAAIWNDEVPPDTQELVLTLNHVCQHGCNEQTRAVIMTLMISVKSACQRGWFPLRESQQLLAFADSMLKSFTGPENVASSLGTSPATLIPQVMERFYPFLKLRHILVSSEAEAESIVLVKDFHISKELLQHPPKPRVGLFVFQTEDISNSSCIIHPQEVSILLNGRGVEKRHSSSMGSRPLRPTNVSNLLHPGSNLLQAIGSFGGSYFIVIALLDDTPLPVNPSLKDYVHSEVSESNSDCDITKFPARVSLSCPISRTRIKLPVKGHVCKHLQCFDFWNYVKINTRIPSWCCPHCHQSVCYTDIRLDQSMIKILKDVESNATDVVISADGSWSVVTENDENVETVPETTIQHRDSMETSVGTQVNKQKPCLSEIPMLNQSSASMDALPKLPQTLNVYDGQQQFMNFPVSAARETIHMPFLPSTSQQDRIATNTGSSHTSMPASAQSSQFQGLHVSPLGLSLGRTSDLMERWNHIYGIGMTQTQFSSMTPPLHHQYAMQNQRLPTRSLSPVQERPVPSLQNQRLPTRSLSPLQERPDPSSITYAQTLAFIQGRTSDQSNMQMPTQRTMQRPGHRPNLGGAMEQFSTRELMHLTPDNSAIRRPQNQMRGSIVPSSTRYDHLIIRPTVPVQSQAQTLPPQQPTYNSYIPVQSQAHTRPPPQRTAYNYIPVQAQVQTLPPSQAFLVSNELPLEEGVCPLGSFWLA